MMRRLRRESTSGTSVTLRGTVAVLVLPAASVQRAVRRRMPGCVMMTVPDHCDQSPGARGCAWVMTPCWSSTSSSTPLTPCASEAVPATLTVAPLKGPATLALGAGEVMFTLGGVVSGGGAATTMKLTILVVTLLA